LASSPNKYYYALDGMGRLYAITDVNTSATPDEIKVDVYNVDGTLLGSTTIKDDIPTGLLGLANRALIKAGGNVHEITISGSAVNAAGKGAALYTVVNNCTDSNTSSVNGAGTNFIRCAHNSGLFILTYDSGSGLYSKASHSVAISSSNDVEWATDKVLVKSGSSIKLCSTPVGATSISCSDTTLPDLDTTLLKDGTTDKYLKSNGGNVFYLSGSTLYVGDIFNPTPISSITVSSATGGNASFNLNKFAFSFGPSSCRNQILYLSSRTASPERYTIAQPSDACVERILKVFSTP